MRQIKKFLTITVSLILLMQTFFLILAPSTIAEDTENIIQSAEINGVIGSKIHPIKTSEWTDITIDIEDVFGLNWNFIQNISGIFLRNFIWPISFGQDVKKYYGYCSLRFEPEVISGDGTGWYFDVIPSSIDKTTGGYNHNIKLLAQIDKSAASYNVVVGLKCTRILSNGEEYGYSYIYIPLRAEHYNLVRMVAKDSKMEGAPRSIVDFKLDITNYGYYEDVFIFDVVSDSGIIAEIHESGLVLEPGETRTVTMSVMLPDKFYDPGTPYKLDVYCNSTGNLEKTFVGSVQIESVGFHISLLVLIIIIFLLLIIIVILYFFFKAKPIKSFKNSKREKSDKKASEGFFSKLFKESEEKPKKEEIKPRSEPIKKEEKPVEVKKEALFVVEPKVDRKAEEERRKKEKALDRVRKQQKKQKL